MENMGEKKTKKSHKKLWSVLLFFILLLVTVYIVFAGTDIKTIFETLISIKRIDLFMAGVMALFFVSIEGVIIWYLLRELDDSCRFIRCIGYAFIGFFFSGITPSSTGGQPMQLYYMKKDGAKLSDGSAVLITVALSYKLVLGIFGLIILTFWNSGLRYYLDNYYYLFLVGLFFNVMIVLLIVMVMAMPKTIKKLLKLLLRFLVFIKILKPSPDRVCKMESFIDNYHNSVLFLKNNEKKILYAMLMTFAQRLSAFSLPYFIYRGFGLSGTSCITIACLQAAIYISVDLLPLPGSQGITEIIYKSIFLSIFSEKFLIPSLVGTRALNFYFLMILSAGVVFIRYIAERIQAFISEKKMKKTA